MGLSPHSGSQASPKPSDQQTDVEAWTEPIPGSVNAPDLPGHTQTPSKRRAEQEGRGDRTSTEGPALRPQQPTAARTGTTEPPFIGDEYMNDEIPPQTVSLLVDRVQPFALGTAGTSSEKHRNMFLEHKDFYFGFNYFYTNESDRS